MIDDKKLIDALEVIKNECASHRRCEECPLFCVTRWYECILKDECVYKWDIEEMRKNV